MQKLGLSREQYDWTQYWDVWKNLAKAQDDLNQAKDYTRYGQGQDVFGSATVPVYDQAGNIVKDAFGRPLYESIIPMASYWTLKAAQQSMESAQLSLDTANDNLSQAQDNLTKSVITAPFAGFVTIVNVKGGDTVQRGVVAVRLVDPTKFEASFMVNENDIFKIKLGQTATLQVNALSSVSLPANVTFMSPTATISAGVVNYQVKVELQSLPKDVQLRDGLTVTVNLPVEQRQNVLLVPYAAITTQGGRSYVKVVSSTGTIEQRQIQTGITNYTYTEVTKGLSEGEKIVVPQGTATTTTTTQQSRPGGIMIPGIGR
jgi:RND family efflux transporter MFP subunit